MTQECVIVLTKGGIFEVKVTHIQNMCLDHNSILPFLDLDNISYNTVHYPRVCHDLNSMPHRQDQGHSSQTAEICFNGYVCTETLTSNISHWIKSKHTLGSLTTNVWIFQIYHGSKVLWSRHRFWLCVHCDLDLKEIILVQDHDTPLGHGQKLYGILPNLIKMRLDISVTLRFPPFLYNSEEERRETEISSLILIRLEYYL